MLYPIPGAGAVCQPEACAGTDEYLAEKRSCREFNIR